MTESKAAYVKAQPQTRNHHCHWPGCEKQCPPAMWGCKPHWFTLPASLRAKIWATYKPGQEITMTPSAAYVAVAKEVQAWIAARAPRPDAPTSQIKKAPVDQTGYHDPARIAAWNAANPDVNHGSAPREDGHG